MKRKLIALSERYATALRKHVKQGPRAGAQPARGLGREAVSLGLETLDVARIHEGALATLETFSKRNGATKRAETFFAEAITPIEQTHRKANTRLNRVIQTFDRRAAVLAAANHSLKQGIARRKNVERALRKSGGHARELLEASHRLQKRLRHLTHRILSAQEDKRKKISQSLQNDVAQTLLGINVRLLMLKKEAVVKATGFKNDVASTQRLAEESVRSIERFAHDLKVHRHA